MSQKVKSNFRLNRHAACVPWVYFIVGCLLTLSFVSLPRTLTHRFIREIVLRLPFHIPGQPVCAGCNVVLISLDTVRADDLPCYGYARNTMINVCAYASKNAMFSRFYSQSSYTLDSHMSIFTGLYPATHHMVNPVVDELNPAIPTLTQYMKRLGYRTIYAGVTDDYALPLTKGLERGFDDIQEVLTWSDDAWPKGYEKLYPQLTDGKPTFLFLHTYAAHFPYLTGDKPLLYSGRIFPDIPLTADEYFSETKGLYQFVLRQFRERSEADKTFGVGKAAVFAAQMDAALRENNMQKAKDLFHSLSRFETDGLFELWYWERVNVNDPAVMAYIRSLYDQRLRYLDDAMKSLFTFLEKPEVRNNTIVIITSDHGEEFMEHGHVLHNLDIYNSTTHVPFILSFPGVAAGRYDVVSQSVDIVPTILSLVGYTLSSVVYEGQNLLPVLYGSNPQNQRMAIGQHRGTWVQSVQNNLWKLYISGEDESPVYELYNLFLDPDERKDLSRSRPDMVKNLYRSFKDIRKRSPYFVPIQTAFPDWIDEATKNKLIENGYF